MSSRALGAFIEIEQTASHTGPSTSQQKSDQNVSGSPTEIELDTLQWGERINGPPTAATPGSDLNQTRDIESSNPQGPREGEVVEVAQSVNNPPMNKWRLLSACFMNLGNGLNDSAPGALIPYLEKDYHIGYAVVSLIFVTNALGFISAAPCTNALESRFGRAKVYGLSLSFIGVGHVALVCKPPFPVVVVCFFLIGYGMAINLALNNVFCANLVNNTVPLGGLHGSYGIGGTVGPLMATAIASHGIRWSFFYFITLGVTINNIILSVWSFRSYEQENSAQLLNTPEQTSSRQANNSQETKQGSLLKEAIRNKVTLLGALFIFAYQGAEVSISGWVVSFLVAYRHGDLSSVGYVSAGFWAGITLGRFLLSHPASKLGKKLSVVLFVVGSIAFQIVTWLLPNVIGNAVAVAIVGLLLGPIYPCCAAVFTTLLPRRIQISSLGFISAMGSSGGAVAPLVTGLLASRVGTMVLHPICIGLYCTMIAAWMSLPRISKRSE